MELRPVLSIAALLFLPSIGCVSQPVGDPTPPIQPVIAAPSSGRPVLDRRREMVKSFQAFGAVATLLEHDASDMSEEDQTEAAIIHAASMVVLANYVYENLGSTDQAKVDEYAAGLLDMIHQRDVEEQQSHQPKRDL